MLTYEKSLWINGIKYVAGVDEVGRGCLAGPIVAAGVIWPTDIEQLGFDWISEIKDSKKLSAKKRDILNELIREHSVSFSIVDISSNKIDQIGIGLANKQALEKASEQLKDVEHTLVDHFTLDPKIPHTSITKGDNKSLSIAAASIIAKVYRDNLMTEFSEQFPEYGFEEHVGYGTKFHKEALSKHGPCEIHRMSFKLG